jgi:integrase
MDQIKISDLQNVITNNCDTFEKAKRCRNLMSLLFKLAAADGYVSKDIPSFVQIPKHEHTEREAFSETEQAALWKLYESGDMRAAIPLLMIYTGMMPGEAMQIKIENIDLKKQQIIGVGKKTKVRKETPVVLANAIIPVVDKLIENARPDGFLWPNYRGAFCPLYYGALEAAKVRKLSPYSCRHTTATALAVTKNIAPETIKKVMRWSSTRMLDNYAHPTQEDALKAVNTL